MAQDVLPSAARAAALSQPDCHFLEIVMKLKALAAIAALATFGTSAMADLISVPTGPLHIKYQNQEQVSFGNNILAPSGAREGNWGIFDVTTIAAGRNVVANTTFAAQTTPLWTSSSGGEYTGIFYGFTVTSTGAISLASGGFMDIYYDPNNDIDLNYDATKRTADDKYTGATDGTLLVSLKMMPGTVAGDNVNTLLANCDIASGAYADCNTRLYADVRDVNGDGKIDPLDGVWAAQMNQDWFYVDTNGNGTRGEAGERRDFYFENRFTSDPSWDGAAGTDVLGANSDDPARVYFVPEPGSLALVGAALFGIGLIRRRKA